MIDLAQLEQQKFTLIAVVADWSPARLAFQPAPDQWSAAQVFDHLVRVEIGIVATARKNLPHPHRIGLRDKLGYRFIERVFQSERQVKAPASAPAIQPQPDPDLPQVLARWSEGRLDLAAFLAELTPEQTRIGIFRHPVAGWMDLPRILGFFSVHMTHHRFQLDRLTAASHNCS